MEKDISCKWKSKERKRNQNQNTHIRQNRLSNKDCNKGQRRALHSDQGFNSRNNN